MCCGDVTPCCRRDRVLRRLHDRPEGSLRSRLRVNNVAGSSPSAGKKVRPPIIRVRAVKLSGDLRAFAAEWNTPSFNRGSPKPNGTRPGLTAAVSGTDNAKTHAHVVN
jgi:hypothetical protein